MWRIAVWPQASFSQTIQRALDRLHGRHDLSDQARPERAGYGVVGTKLEKAAGTCKQVCMPPRGSRVLEIIIGIQVVQLAPESSKPATRS